MTSDSLNPVYDSFSSGPTAASERCEATLELGRRLTKELGIDQSVDTLGRWMAHYVAELIQNAENASSEERSVKMRICCDTIVNIWNYRHSLPDGKRPFEELEPFLRTIESLDPEENIPRYFSSIRTAADDAEENNETKTLLKFIDDLDYSAKLLIRYFLTKAAKTAVNKSLEWVNLAEAAGTDESAEISLLSMIFSEDSLLTGTDPAEVESKLIEIRIARLETFVKKANAVISELRQND